MKISHVWRESVSLYKKNFAQLLLTLLVELVLRAIALCPLLFCADASLAPLAWMAVPLYLLIVLPARENFALALQDMLNGGSVFSVRLISTADYGRKLLRGLKGTLCMLCWSALTIAGLVWLYASVMGLVDFVTLMRIFAAIGGGDFVGGVMRFAAAIAFTLLLILLGCAVHSGTRHALAMGEKGLLQGRRLRLTALWFAGLLLVLPFAAVAAIALGDAAVTLIHALKNLQLPGFVLNLRQTLLLVGGALVLLCPVLPLKSLLPAVYLRMEKEQTHDAA